MFPFPFFRPVARPNRARERTVSLRDLPVRAEPPVANDNAGAIRRATATTPTLAAASRKGPAGLVKTSHVPFLFVQKIVILKRARVSTRLVRSPKLAVQLLLRRDRHGVVVFPRHFFLGATEPPRASQQTHAFFA
jgi:hypothetical protein